MSGAEVVVIRRAQTVATVAMEAQNNSSYEGDNWTIGLRLFFKKKNKFLVKVIKDSFIHFAQSKIVQ